MPLTTEEIVELRRTRQQALNPRLEKMRELRDAYQGDMTIPLPEVSTAEKPAVANLIAQGLDQSAMRVASTMPDAIFPPLRQGIQLSENRASDRRSAVLSWWSMNKLHLIQRKRARWLLGYAMAPVVIRPDLKRLIPRWHARDPLQCLPPPGDEMTPTDCFTGDTEFITKEHGVVSLGEMVDQTITVLTRDGWAKGEVRYFGRRAVQQVTFAPAVQCGGRGLGSFKAARTNHRVTVRTTPGHRWPLVDGTITTSLQVGDTVQAVATQETDDLVAYEEGFRHGLIFGDGSHRWVYGNGDHDHSIQLCGAKQRFTTRFERVKYPSSANGDPVCYLRRPENLKNFPVGKSPDYLRGFVDGWAATDGCDLGNGTVRITSQHPQAFEWLSHHAALAGWVVRGRHMKPIAETTYGMRSAPLYDIPMVRQERAAGWKVVAIEALPEDENLFCAVVPGPEKFALASGVYSGNCVFTFNRTYGWLRTYYPEHMRILYTGRDPKPDDHYTLVEYVDSEITTLIVVAKERGQFDRGPHVPGGSDFVELERFENRAGICPAVVPTRIGLDAPMGQFDGLIGLFWNQAKLMALELIAIQRGIFPDEWLISRQNEVADILEEADGLRGEIGRISGGDIVQRAINPGMQTYPTIDRLERAMRLTGGIPAEFGGECCDAETEILTASGWKRYDEVAVGDEVLTLNHETGMSEWQPILKMNVFPAAVREVVEMEGPRFSALTTVNHRWPVVRWNGARAWRTSTELTSSDRIPIAARNAHLPVEAKWSDALVELVAWYWTEGTTNQGHCSIAKSPSRYPVHAERIRRVLRELFGPPTERFPRQGRATDGIPRWRETKPNKRGVVEFHLSAEARRVVTEHAPGYEKVPTFDFLRSLTAAQLELFIDVSMLADNCGEAKFGQVSRARAEAFAFACILSGRGVSYRTRIRSTEREGWRDGPYKSYIVRMRGRRFANPKENARRGVSVFRRVIHDGIAWCPTTLNGTWFARRDGSAYFTGNSTSNIRTGRRGQAVLSAAVDHTIQEAQEILAASLHEEDVRAIAIDRAYFGDWKKAFYFDWKGEKGQVDYTPNEIFETDEHSVYYSYPGSDINTLVIGTGQRIGMGTMSKRRGMELDPLIDNPAQEHARILVEGLEQAGLSALQQAVASGQISPDDWAFIAAQVEVKRKPLYEAVQLAQERAQKRQASSGPPGTPEGPVDPGSPEAQLGLAAGPAGAAAPEAIPAGPPSLANLSMLLANLRRPQTQATATG